MNTARPIKPAAAWWHGAALLMLLAAGPGWAQYKVIGADGKVTYTDRAPTTTQGKVSTMNSRGGSSAPVDVSLPFELRQVATRYPVTLYTADTGCDPCAAARQMLRRRGVPYAEKTVVSAEDGEALERLSGGRDAPTLSIGSQTLRGLAPEVWNSYLDAAGYPRESRLPANYQYPQATPLVERQVARQQAAAPAPAPAPTPAPQPGAAGIKF
jgi:glutaredoxin